MTWDSVDDHSSPTPNLISQQYVCEVIYLITHLLLLQKLFCGNPCLSRRSVFFFFRVRVVSPTKEDAGSNPVIYTRSEKSTA